MNGNSILKKRDVKRMRDMYSSGNYSYRDLVRLFDISQTQVARIIKRESWSWLD